MRADQLGVHVRRQQKGACVAQFLIGVQGTVLPQVRYKSGLVDNCAHPVFLMILPSVVMWIPHSSRGSSRQRPARAGSPAATGVVQG